MKHWENRMIFDSDSDQKILNPPWSDKYLKSIKVKEDDMSNLRVKVKEIILDSIEYGRTHQFYHTRKLQLSEEEIVHKGIFVDDKTDQIISFIEEEGLRYDLRRLNETREEKHRRNVRGHNRTRNK